MAFGFYKSHHSALIMVLNRRAFVKNSLKAVAAAGAAHIWTGNHAAVADTLTPVPTGGLLPIPELLENLDKSGRRAVFEMNAQKGSVTFFPGYKTATMGYNGSFLGPTIRVRNGQPFKLNLKNSLPQVTTLHWHGLHVPAIWDGGPRQPIAPGSTWKPDFTIRQEAATLWYHPHAMGRTGWQVYQGLAGFFIIDDDFSDKLDIPRTYGVDDIPLVIQDRRFSSNGQFSYTQSMHDVINGVVGNYLLVNGALRPTLQTHNGLIRFRLLNGSNSTIYRIGFDDKRSFHMIASDGGFLEKPVRLNHVVLSPGERAEVLVDFSNPGPGDYIGLKVDQMRGLSFEAMKIVVTGSSPEKKQIPEVLRPFDKIPESSAGRVRRFSMETMSRGPFRRGRMGMMGNRLTINGKRMDLSRIDERVDAGSTEIWEISNSSGMMMNMPHSMHLHDVQFQILTRNGKLPAPEERGRKDTVLLMPGETVRIVVRFGTYKGIYMYHCHLLEHEDDGMMGQFEVV